jgi:gamma-glutamyl-gamma-aminobutyrate hydrolase PuuD
MPSVYIVGTDHLMTTMFLRRGWDVLRSADEDTNLIVFTGGEDVDPSHYGDIKHPTTHSNPRRDAFEIGVFNEWKKQIPMAGICRGAQLLNVMNGGLLWQNVNNHNRHKGHSAYCHLTEESVWVTSVHHQMMIPTDQAKKLLTAEESTLREQGNMFTEGAFEDIEAVLYEDTRCLCYQPHPEYVKLDDPCQDNFFRYLTLIL